MFKEFQGASYLKRYNLLCQRLMQESLYSAAPRTAAADGAYTDLDDLTSLKTFVTLLAGHIAAEAAR